MKLTEIIELAKAGYKPSDIKELISMGAEEPKAEEPKAEEPQKDTTDYKALYEATQQKLAELQDQNSRAPIEEEPLKIEEIVKSVKRSIN